MRIVRKNGTLIVVTEEQTLITDAVARYLDRQHISHREMARRMGVPSSNFHARMKGVTRWSTRDLVNLSAQGVPLPPLGDLTAGAGVVS